jgi:hypothetical protein
VVEVLANGALELGVVKRRVPAWVANRFGIQRTRRHTQARSLDSALLPDLLVQALCVIDHCKGPRTTLSKARS